MTWNAADRAAAPGARAAQEHIRKICFHAPGAGFILAFGEGEGQIAVKGISFWQLQSVLQIQRRFGLDAKPAVSIHSQVVAVIPLDPGINGAQVILCDFLFAFFIFMYEPALRHLQAKHCKSVIPVPLELRGKDRRIGETVTVHFTG